MIRARGVAAAIVLLMAACGRAPEPERPAGVPAGAIWIGGADGGVYAKIRRAPEAKPGELEVEIFAETGVSVYKGPVRLEPPDAPLERLDDPSVFSAWDGETLHLRDGRALHGVAGETIR